MEKQINEDELRGLEAEIDSAVDRLFVEKGGEPIELSLLEPAKASSPGVQASVFSAKEPKVEVEKPLQAAREPGVLPVRDLEDELFAMAPPAAREEPKTGLDPIERLETILLSLEWEITREGLEKAREEVKGLRHHLKDNLDASSVLAPVENVLSMMMESDSEIRPSLIKFLIDAKETLKLLLKDTADREFGIYQRLAREGLEARFACLKKESGSSGPFAPPSIQKNEMEERLARLEEKVDVLEKKIDLISVKSAEIYNKVEELFSRLENKESEKIGRTIEGKALADFAIFTVDGRFFAVPNERVFKLYRVSRTFWHKYRSSQKVRVKDDEIKLVNLWQLFSIEHIEPEKDLRLLVIKQDGDLKGIMVEQLVEVLRTSYDSTSASDLVLGTIFWKYKQRSVEVAVLDIKNL